MTNQIWKFPLRDRVPMPVGAAVLTVQLQNGEPHLWALVDPTQPLKVRRFFVFGTGEKMSVERVGHYVDTYQQPPFVWHVFEAPL